MKARHNKKMHTTILRILQITPINSANWQVRTFYAFQMKQANLSVNNKKKSGEKTSPTLAMDNVAKVQGNTMTLIWNIKIAYDIIVLLLTSNSRSFQSRITPTKLVIDPMHQQGASCHLWAIELLLQELVRYATMPSSSLPRNLRSSPITVPDYLQPCIRWKKEDNQ